MHQMPHCCRSWRTAPARRVTWSKEESRAIRAITMPASTWIQPWRSRQQQRRGKAPASAKSGADSGEGWSRTKARGHQGIQHSTYVLLRWAWTPGLSTTTAACMTCRSSSPFTRTDGLRSSECGDEPCGKRGSGWCG
jgi:hypothetical protein